MGKLWWVFLILSFIFALFNPYVGMFGVFLAVELMLYFAFVVNIQQRISFTKYSKAENGEDKHTIALRASSKKLIKVFRVLSVILFVLVTLMSLGVWALGSGEIFSSLEPTEMAPFSIFSEKSQAVGSVILLVASISFNLLATVSIFMLCKQFLTQLMRDSR